MLSMLITSGREAALAQAVSSSPMFPPSFDGSPILFGASLCARLLIMMMSAAVIVRIMSGIYARGGQVDYASHVRSLCLLSLMWALLFGSTSDVITWLAWGEVDAPTMSFVMASSRVLDTLTAFPFLMALYVPAWAEIASRMGLCPRPLWFADRVPLPAGLTAPKSLAIWCVVCAIGVTITKWMAWHGAHAVG